MPLIALTFLWCCNASDSSSYDFDNLSQKQIDTLAWIEVENSYVKMHGNAFRKVYHRIKNFGFTALDDYKVYIKHKTVEREMSVEKTPMPSETFRKESLYFNLVKSRHDDELYEKSIHRIVIGTTALSIPIPVGFVVSPNPLGFVPNPDGSLERTKIACEKVVGNIPDFEIHNMQLTVSSTYEYRFVTNMEFNVGIQAARLMAIKGGVEVFSEGDGYLAFYIPQEFIASDGKKLTKHSAIIVTVIKNTACTLNRTLIVPSATTQQLEDLKLNAMAWHNAILAANKE